MTKAARFMVLLSLSVLMLSADGLCAVFNVSDPVGFQAALTSAQSNGESDTIYVSPGTYNITTTLTYETPDGDGRLDIRALNPMTPPVLDGGGAVQIMLINNDSNDDDTGDAGEDIAISNLIFNNGHMAGGDATGGALKVRTALAAITVQNCTFTGNSSEWVGGGLVARSKGGPVMINSNVFNNNSADHNGGGLFVRITDNPSQVSIINNTFDRNRANSGGGGLYSTFSAGTVTMSRNSFTNNSASGVQDGGGGGLVAFSQSATMTFSNNAFENNQAGYNGGGARIGSLGADINITHNTFMQNSSGNYGGGLSAGTRNAGGNVTIEGNILMRNSSDQDGGGVYAVTLGGGGVWLINNILNANQTSGSGGGIAAATNYDRVSIINNTVYGNNAANEGGGIDVDVSNDEGPYYPVALIYNNIIYGNSGATGDDVYVDPSDESDVYLFHNDIGPNNDDFSGNSEDLVINNLPNATYHQTGNIDSDPALVNPTGGDFHISSSSPCINVGFNDAPDISSIDFEGDPRIINGTVDIGADEAGSQVAAAVPAMTNFGTIVLILTAGLLAVLSMKREKNFL